MAAPLPPQGNQRQVTERPPQVYSEQYVEGAPLPIGAEIDPGTPPLFADGVPRVLTSTGWVVLELTQWVISSRYSGQALAVISDEEFSERYVGPSAG